MGRTTTRWPCPRPAANQQPIGADAAQGNPPAGLDYPLADLAEVLGALVADFRADMNGHFADVLEAHGLQMVEPPLW